MKTKSSVFSARNIAYLAVLLALTVVLQLFGSQVKIFGLSLNFSLIPIVLAGILLGPICGALMGFISGLIVFVTSAFGGEPFTTLQFQLNPVILVITCFGKTTIAGLVSALLYRLIAKKNRIVACYVASLITPVVNTSLYIIGCLIMKSATLQGLRMDETSVGALFAVIVSLVYVNFLLEIAVTVIITPAISFVTNQIEKRTKKVK